MLPIFSLGAPSAAVLSWMEFSTQTHVAHTSLSPSVSVIPLLSCFLPVALPLVRSFSVCLSPFTPTTLFPFHPRDLSCASSAILAGRYSSVTPSVSFDSCISTGVWSWRISRTVGTTCPGTRSTLSQTRRENAENLSRHCPKIGFSRYTRVT